MTSRVNLLRASLYPSDAYSQLASSFLFVSIICLHSIHSYFYLVSETPSVQKRRKIVVIGLVGLIVLIVIVVTQILSFNPASS